MRESADSPQAACTDDEPNSATAYHGGRKGASYIFSIFGLCSARHQAQLLTSAQLLKRTRPLYPIAAMLSPTCWRNCTFRELLEAEQITPLFVPRINNITCRGVRQRGSFFDEHWTKLNLLNLTGLRVAMYLDSDVVIQQNIDSVVRQMLLKPTLAEARTPQGCLKAGAASTWFNTGVWAVRPDAVAFGAMLNWVRRGGSACYDGDQSAAMGYWRVNGPGKRRADQLMLLHVGFNMKADQGPEQCLQKHELNQSDLHIVHFSGKQKPFVAKPGKDATWHRARQQYVEVFDGWAAKLHVPGCTARQQFSDQGCYVDT